MDEKLKIKTIYEVLILSSMNKLRKCTADILPIEWIYELE